MLFSLFVVVVVVCVVSLARLNGFVSLFSTTQFLFSSESTSAATAAAAAATTNFSLMIRGSSASDVQTVVAVSAGSAANVNGTTIDVLAVVLPSAFTQTHVRLSPSIDESDFGSRIVWVTAIRACIGMLFAHASLSLAPIFAENCVRDTDDSRSVQWHLVHVFVVVT